MPWSWTSAAKADTNYKGKTKGGGGNGPPTAAGSGGAAASSSKRNDAQQISKLEAEKKAANQRIAKLEAEKKAENKNVKKHWTCTYCGDTKCFATRKDCHACGKLRAGWTPPGLEHAPAAAMAVEVVEDDIPLEQLISEVDAEVKANKGAKTPLGKAHLAALEATLLQLKEQQRRERPLPARLQAATHRYEKVTSDEADLMKELAVHEGHITKIKAKLVEVADVRMAAAKELEAVKAMAGAGALESGCSNFAKFVSLELNKLGMQEQQVTMLMQTVWGQMQQGMVPQQPGLQAPAAAAAPATPQAQPPTAAEAAAAMNKVRLANMGAALAAAAAQEQAAQAQAAAAQAAAATQAAAAIAAAQVAAEATQQRATILAAAQAEELQQQQRQQLAQAGSVAAPGGGLGRPRGRSPASEADSGDSGRFTAARSRSDEKKLRKKAKQLRAAEQRAARAAGLGCC